MPVERLQSFQLNVADIASTLETDPEQDNMTTQAMGEVRKVLHGVKIADCPPELREKLQQYDTNGNGIIDPSELPDPLTTAAPYISVGAFPKTLQPILREIDDEKNGRLEMDELTEVFTVYAEMKKANKEGSISIKTLPKEIQPTLKAFDVDGDGTVAPLELARAAELYKQSKKTAKRLMIFAGVLMVILCALVGVIVGLTAVVVEESKESKASGDGTLTKKGTSTPIAVGEAVKSSSIFDVVGMTPASLGGVKSLMLAKGTTTRSFTVTGFTAKPGLVTFNTASGYAVVVSPKDYKIINIGADLVVATVTKTASARRRNLLAAMPEMDKVIAGQTNEDGKNGVTETCPTAAEPLKPIKCFDGSCQLTMLECPPVPGNVTETPPELACAEHVTKTTCETLDPNCKWNALVFTCAIKTATEPVADGAKNEDEKTPCATYITEATCEEHPCDWHESLCSEKKDEHKHEDEKTPCATYITEATCEEHPCDWHESLCSEKKDEHKHEDEKTPCATYITEATCEEHPCDWHESLCSEKKDEHKHEDEKTPCATYTTKNTCEDQKCDWHDDLPEGTKCSEEEETPCATYTTKNTCEDQKCDWHKELDLCSEKKDEHEEKSPGTDPAGTAPEVTGDPAEAAPEESGGPDGTAPEVPYDPAFPEVPYDPAEAPEVTGDPAAERPEESGGPDGTAPEESGGPDGTAPEVPYDPAFPEAEPVSVPGTRRVRRNLADGIECEMHSNCASGYCHTPQCFMEKEGKMSNCKKLCMAKSWWTKSN
ncbi:EF-hand domain-containing protein [Pycnococcus provasolii]